MKFILMSYVFGKIKQMEKNALIQGPKTCQDISGSVIMVNIHYDLLSQPCQSISLILRLDACSTNTILIASVQKP